VGSHENKQQGHGPGEECKDRALAGHVDDERALRAIDMIMICS